MINLPPAEIDDAAFTNCCESLPPDVKERIAGAFPSYFTAAFVFPGSGADVRPASPGPAKAREPKATPTVDKEALTAQVFAYVKSFPGCRSEDVDVSALSGMDAKAANRLVRAILEKAVDSKAAFCEGNGRGRRYKVAVKATEPEEGAAE